MAGLRSAALFHVLLFLFAGCCGVRGAAPVTKKPDTTNILVNRKETTVKIVTSPQTPTTTMDPCQTMKCGLNEVCVSLNNQSPQCVSSKNSNSRTETPVPKVNVKNCNSCPVSSSSPVCGSDGLTYASQCKLEEQACLTGTTLTVKCSGPCPCVSAPPIKNSAQTSSNSNSGSNSGSSSASKSAPTTTMDPCQTMKCGLNEVCVSLNNQSPQCVSSKNSNSRTETPVPKVNVKNCNSCPVSSSSPVCGSDGLTYASQCKLEEQACLTGTTLTVKCSGPCPCVSAPPIKNSAQTSSNSNSGSNSGSSSASKSAPTTTMDPCQTMKCGLNEVCVSLNNQSPQCVSSKNSNSRTETPVPKVNVKNCNSCPVSSSSPVCGSDGLTYGSQCKLEEQACLTGTTLTVKCSGPCPCVSAPPIKNSAQTSSNSNSGSSSASKSAPTTTMDPCQTMKCGLNEVCVSLNNQSPQCVSSKNSNSRTETPVPKVNVKNCNSCPVSSSSPVCGSDGLTYASQCKLEEQACLTGTTLTVKCSGPCPCVSAPPIKNSAQTSSNSNSGSSSASKSAPTTTMDPCQTIKCGLNEVCVSLNNKSPQCVSSKNSNSRTETPVPKGNVKNCKSCPVSSSSPVCGSDGLTYGSQCKLEQQACLTGTTLTVKCSGPCPCVSAPPKKNSAQTSSNSNSGSKSGSKSGSNSGSSSASKSDESSSSSGETGSGAGSVDSEEDSKESDENTKESESSEENSSQQHAK